MKIRFDYLHRDAGNYKNFGSVVLRDSKHRSLEEIENAIVASLIDGQYFYAQSVGFPVLYGQYFDPMADATWHEFESIAFEHDDTSKVNADLEAVLGKLDEAPISMENIQ